jgi:hypothetical protein
METAFCEFGLPLAMRTDNGPPFASNAVAGLSRLSVWLIRLGVRPERIEPGQPRQNGRHERFHRTLEAETAKPPEASRPAQQRAFERFRREFNEERPHEALAMRTPASIYAPSPRPYPEHLPQLEYPAAYEVRRVRPNGEIEWAGELMYVGQVWAGELVGLEPLDGRHWRMHFETVDLGTVDGWNKEWATKDVRQTNEVLPISPSVHSRGPSPYAIPEQPHLERPVPQPVRHLRLHVHGRLEQRAPGQQDHAPAVKPPERLGHPAIEPL